MTIRRALSLWAIILFAACFFVRSAEAQTTYQMLVGPYQWSGQSCEAESFYPVHAFGQLQCLINLATANNPTVQVGTIQFNREGAIVLINIPSAGIAVYPGEYFNNKLTELSFAQPGTCTTNATYPWTQCPDSLTLKNSPFVETDAPGTFSFKWQQLNYPSGTYIYGNASGTWQDHVICGGRGCQYHNPFIWSFSLTVN